MHILTTSVSERTPASKVHSLTLVVRMCCAGQTERHWELSPQPAQWVEEGLGMLAISTLTQAGFPLANARSRAGRN